MDHRWTGKAWGLNFGLAHSNPACSVEDVSVGLLKDTTFFLFIGYQHSRYVGLMSFDDSISCQRVYDLLKPNVGHSIEEIRGPELEP